MSHPCQGPIRGTCFSHAINSPLSRILDLGSGKARQHVLTVWNYCIYLIKLTILAIWGESFEKLCEGSRWRRWEWTLFGRNLCTGSSVSSTGTDNTRQLKIALPFKETIPPKEGKAKGGGGSLVSSALEQGSLCHFLPPTWLLCGEDKGLSLLSMGN